MAANESQVKKRTRVEFEEPQPQTQVGSRIRSIRVKNAGTRSTSKEQRNKRIVECAEQIPANNSLPARSAYWFVTTEEVEVLIKDTQLFIWEEKITHTDEKGLIHYLNRVNFRKNKRGVLAFRFPNGEELHVNCNSTATPRTNKRPKHAQSGAAFSETIALVSNQVGEMQIEEESQALFPATLQNNNNNTPLQFPLDPVPSGDISSEFFQPEDFDFSQVVPLTPQEFPNGIQLPAGTPLVTNILLLVPEREDSIQMVDTVLLGLGFVKEVSSNNHQYLYSQKNLNHMTRHVLLFPYSYARADRLYKIKDYLPATSEVILLLENEGEQQSNFMVISRITNIHNNPNYNWQFTHKPTSLPLVELNHTTLNASAKTILIIGELRSFVLGGSSWKQSLLGQQLADSFKAYFLEWTLALMEMRVVQNIFICFKYEPEIVQAFTDYASATLAALGIEHVQDPIVVYGSVLVYIRCPSYLLWYIIQRKKYIFDTLSKYELTEIYECFISNVEASMKRPGNEEFANELAYLQEQMISDGVAEEPTPNRFVVTRGSDSSYHGNGLHIPFSEIKLGEMIGEGSYGIVYQAEYNNKKYAIKRFRSGFGAKKEDVLKEAEVLMKLRHKHLVSLVGISTDPSTEEIMLVMEYMENGSLEDLLVREVQLSREDVIKMGLDVAKGLYFLHSQKIIHRRLKSANVLLYEHNNKKRAKLSDFSTARIFGDRALNRATTIIGMYGFIAPEILREEPYGAKADVYLFGALLFHMLTLTTLPVIVKDVDASTRIKEQVKDVKFQELIIKCCKQEPEERPTIDECIARLVQMQYEIKP